MAFQTLKIAKIGVLKGLLTTYKRDQYQTIDLAWKKIWTDFPHPDQRALVLFSARDVRHRHRVPSSCMPTYCFPCCLDSSFCPVSATTYAVGLCFWRQNTMIGRGLVCVRVVEWPLTQAKTQNKFMTCLVIWHSYCRQHPPPLKKKKAVESELSITYTTSSQENQQENLLRDFCWAELNL